MKISKELLKKLIKEELESVSEQAEQNPANPAPPAPEAPAAPEEAEDDDDKLPQDVLESMLNDMQRNLKDLAKHVGVSLEELEERD